jgi:hypothetical protein
VLMTSCQVLLKSKMNPEMPQPAMSRMASVNTAGRPVVREAALEKRVNQLVGRVGFTGLQCCNNRAAPQSKGGKAEGERRK